MEKVTDGRRQTVKAKPAPAKAAPAKKAKPAPAAKPKAGDFGVVPGSFQEKLLTVLRKHLKSRWRSARSWWRSMGGTRPRPRAAPSAIVIGGVKAKAQANGHDVVRERDDTGPTLTLIKGGKRL